MDFSAWPYPGFLMPALTNDFALLIDSTQPTLGLGEVGNEPRWLIGWLRPSSGHQKAFTMIFNIMESKMN